MTSSVRIEDLQTKYEQNSRRYFAPLASELRRAGDARRAVALCEAGLAADPEHLSGHVVLAQALVDLGDRAGAERSFARAIELDPENIVALRSLGDLARDRGDREAARGWYQHALEADPRDPELATRLSTLDSASTAESPPTGGAAGAMIAVTAEATEADSHGRPPSPHAVGDTEAASAASGAESAQEQIGGAGAVDESAAAAAERALVTPPAPADSSAPSPVVPLLSDELDVEFQRQREAEEFTAGFFASVLEADRAATVPAEVVSEPETVESEPETEAPAGASAGGETVAGVSEGSSIDASAGDRAGAGEFLDDLLEFPSESEDDDQASNPSAEHVESETAQEFMVIPESGSDAEVLKDVPVEAAETGHPIGMEAVDSSSSLPGDNHPQLDRPSEGVSPSEATNESVSAPTIDHPSEQSPELTEPPFEWTAESAWELSVNASDDAAQSTSDMPTELAAGVAPEPVSETEAGLPQGQTPASASEPITESDPDRWAEPSSAEVTDEVSDVTTRLPASEETAEPAGSDSAEGAPQGAVDRSHEQSAEAGSDSVSGAASAATAELTSGATAESASGLWSEPAAEVASPFHAESSDEREVVSTSALTDDPMTESAGFDSPESTPAAPRPGTSSPDQVHDGSGDTEWREEIPSERSCVEISTDLRGSQQPPVAGRSEAVPAESPVAQDAPVEQEFDQAASIDAVATTPAGDGNAVGEESSRLPFVTVTMGRLLLQQGFRSDALRLFRQLAVQNPDDAEIRDQVAELEVELNPSGAGGGGVTVGRWLQELARMRPPSGGEEEDASAAASPASEGVEPVGAAAALPSGDVAGGLTADGGGPERQTMDAPAPGSDLLSSATAAAASAVSWEAGDPDPSIDDFLFSDDPLEWGEVISPPADHAVTASELTLDELLGRPVSAADEMAAGALASATMAMQHDRETDAQLAEASAEDPGALEYLLARPSAADVTATRETGSFSFEQFFQTEATARESAEAEASGASSPPIAEPTPVLPAGGATGDDEEAAAREADLADFHAWLSGLSKS